MFHNENKLIFALKRKFVVVGLFFFVCFFFFLRREQRRKGEERWQEAAWDGVGGEGSRDGAGNPAERLSRLRAARTLGRRQRDPRPIGWMDGWMDGWMVAPSQMENRLGTSGLVLWPCGLYPMASALLSAPVKSQHPTGEGLFSHTVLSVCNATLPTLCPHLYFFPYTHPPHPWNRALLCLLQIASLPWSPPSITLGP